MRMSLICLAAVLLAQPAGAAEPGGGGSFGLEWLIPFTGMLLSIAVLPLAAPKFWHHHFGKVALGWAIVFAVPYALTAGAEPALKSLWHAFALEYVPFIVLLYALFAVAGGILVRGDIRGTPAANTGMIAFGTMIASLFGTTGAAMLMIRPLIRANAARPRNVHVFVFFIFLVANIGGSLTPLGDPPLFLGFLNGVGFFWTARHLFVPAFLTSTLLLLAFYLIDRHFYRREGSHKPRPDSTPVEILGAHNVMLMLAIMGVVLGSTFVDRTMGMEIYGSFIGLDSIVRCGGLIAVAAISLFTTRDSIRVENAFTWGPMIEVALLFIGIFVTIIPAIAMLQAGEDGPLASMIALLQNPNGTHNAAVYFWLTGGLSAFLDNAPTYLVFFHSAGGDARELMRELSPTLTAISAGAVFFGAATYIGNAPNFMVKTICEERGIAMPSFFGFMAWSAAILLPVFALNTVLFF